MASTMGANALMCTLCSYYVVCRSLLDKGNWPTQTLSAGQYVGMWQGLCTHEVVGG